MTSIAAPVSEDTEFYDSLLDSVPTDVDHVDRWDLA